MMKKIVLLMLSGVLCYSQTFETLPLLQNGANDKRINMAILGDGFTDVQQTEFITSAQASMNYLFNKSPYLEYKNYFNVYVVKVISAESGVKHPGTATNSAEPIFPVSNPNNFLGSSFDTGGTHRCMYGNNTKVGQVLSANVPDYDVAYILSNSTQYGGCGGAYAFASLDNSSNEILVHELGHSFGRLADEYWTNAGESHNKTQNSNPATVKWRNWVGTGEVGVYPFPEDNTWYRPHQNCEMRFLNRPFCAVCRETIIEKIHSLVSPIESYTPANSTAVDGNSNVTFTVNEILPIPNTLVNSWKINGTLLAATGNSITISPGQLNSGSNTLLFSVSDNTTLVKVDNHHTVHFANITWTLNKTVLGVSEIKAQERRFGIYPNPFQSEFVIKGKQDFSGKIDVNIYDMSGKLIAAGFERLKPDALLVHTNNLPPGTYMLNITEDNTLIISQKIIKE